jgi:hypothetical protein
MASGASINNTSVLIKFPNGETRQIAPGPSSIITQAVIEKFAKQYLEDPVVLWLSESGNHVVVRDERIAHKIGLHIEPENNLPDLILADLGPADPLIIFIEVVATDGAITPRRMQAIFKLTDSAGFNRSQIAFLTAYQSRESSGFKKTFHQLAWGSFVWFVIEPEELVLLQEKFPQSTRFHELASKARSLQ